MDMTPKAIIATNICGLLMTCTVLGSLFPSYMSIRDIQLKISMGLYFAGFLLAITTNTLGWSALQNKNMVDFGRFNVACSTFFIVAFVSQSFYSLRRTCMIYMLRPSLQLWLPIGVTIVQCAIQFTNSAFWAIDMQKYYGTQTSNQTAHTTIASIVWILASEPIFFGLLQYQIVKSATRFERKKSTLKAVGLWIEAAVRLVLYIATVLICYLAVSDYLPQLAFWSCVNILPASIGMIFLTDIMRFQRALGKGDMGPSNSSSTKMRRFAPGVTSGGPTVPTAIIMAADAREGVLSSMKGEPASSVQEREYQYGWDLGTAKGGQGPVQQGTAPAWNARKSADGY
ncbi:hypothetical protein HK104_002785, partial [Borealophlyctis nickersoniae]